jgi:hypothetical protein
MTAVRGVFAPDIYNLVASGYKNPPELFDVSRWMTSFNDSYLLFQDDSIHTTFS